MSRRRRTYNLVVAYNVAYVNDVKVRATRCGGRGVLTKDERMPHHEGAGPRLTTPRVR